MLEWQLLDLRAKVPGGCYFIGWSRSPDEELWVGRYCTDPRADPQGICMNGTRINGIGKSSELQEVKELCQHDAEINFGKTRVY